MRGRRERNVGIVSTVSIGSFIYILVDSLYDGTEAKSKTEKV